jgi:hypothetical protein
MLSPVHKALGLGRLSYAALKPRVIDREMIMAQMKTFVPSVVSLKGLSLKNQIFK